MESPSFRKRLETLDRSLWALLLTPIASMSLATTFGYLGWFGPAIFLAAFTVLAMPFCPVLGGMLIRDQKGIAVGFLTFFGAQLTYICVLVLQVAIVFHLFGPLWEIVSFLAETGVRVSIQWATSQ